MESKHSDAYLATRVNTSDGMGLVIALYEAALASLDRAMQALEDDDDATRSESISHVSQIIMALSDAIDYTQPGPLAGDLFSLYNFQMRQLLEANRTKDAEPLQVVKSTLNSLLEAWRQVAAPSASPAEAAGQDIENVVRNRVDGFNLRRPSLRLLA